MTTPNLNEQSRIYIGKQRKDGKISCEFVFPISGARSNRLLTVEQLEEQRSKGFMLIWKNNVPFLQRSFV